MKGNVSLFSKQRYEGVEDVHLQSFLILEQDGSEWSASLPNFFTLNERVAHWIEGKGGHRTVLEIVEERKIFCPCPEIRFLAFKKIQ
jgi:hypothetical protein